MACDASGRLTAFLLSAMAGVVSPGPSSIAEGRAPTLLLLSALAPLLAALLTVNGTSFEPPAMLLVPMLPSVGSTASPSIPACVAACADTLAAAAVFRLGLLAPLEEVPACACLCTGGMFPAIATLGCWPVRQELAPLPACGDAEMTVLSTGIVGSAGMVSGEAPACNVACCLLARSSACCG